MRKFLALMLFIVFALTAFALTACGESNNDVSIIRPEATGPVDVGSAAPDFTLELLDGGTVQLAELKGKPVVVNFFATWCQWCVYEMPDIEKIYNDYGDDIHVVIIDVDEPIKDVERFLEKTPYPMPFALDDGGKVAKLYEVGGFPQTFFIDADGVISAIAAGAVDDAYMRDKIDPMLT